MAAHVLQVLRLEEHHRPVGADQGEGGGAGAEVGPVAEEREVDDRLAHPVLEPPEGVERRQARHRDHGGRRAAPGPALHQRQDDRGQADAEREQAGEVDPAPGAGIGGLGRRDAVIAIPTSATGRLIQKITRQSISTSSAAGQRPDRQRQRPRPQPRPQAPAPVRRPGRRCRRSPARAAASAPRRSPAGSGRAISVSWLPAPRRAPSRARRPPCRRGRAACARTCRRAAPR